MHTHLDFFWGGAKTLRHIPPLDNTAPRPLLTEILNIPLRILTHCYEFFPHWHAKLHAMAYTVCRANASLASRVAYASR